MLGACSFPAEEPDGSCWQLGTTFVQMLGFVLDRRAVWLVPGLLKQRRMQVVLDLDESVLRLQTKQRLQEHEAVWALRK